MKARIDPQVDGAKVEKWRKKRKLTGTELARRAQISRQHCVRIRHMGFDASLGAQQRLAVALEVPIEAIQKDAS